MFLPIYKTDASIPALNQAFPRENMKVSLRSSSIMGIGRQLAGDAQGKRGRMPRRDVRLPSDSKMSGNRKARYRFPGAGLVLAMVNICR
jgi:hypothetical protein